MTLLFSNERLFNTFALEFSLVACFFVTIGIMSLTHFWLSLLFFALAALSVGIVMLTQKQMQNTYLELKSDRIIMYKLISAQRIEIENSDIEIIVRRGEILILQMKGDAKDIKLSLNYLKQDDIKKLLLFLSYVPSLKTTFL